MQIKPKPGNAPGFDPGLIEVATRRAHQLRTEAINDAQQQLARSLRLWLRRRLSLQPKTKTRQTPCHS